MSRRATVTDAGSLLTKCATMYWRWPTILALAMLSVAAHGANSPCIATQAVADNTACEQYLQSILEDAHALRSLGRQLEMAGRYDRATEIYRRALKTHRADRHLQQGLIRARSEQRARSLLAGLDNTAQGGRQSACWLQRWGDAVTACAREIGRDTTNWELHERYGDVLRSVGRPIAAIEAYQTSLQLNETNAHLQRKLRTLSELVDLEKADLVDAVPPQDFARSVSATKSAPILDHGRYRAVVIGNQNYDNFQNLESPFADARAVSDVLHTEYGFEVTTMIDATRYELFEMLSELRRDSERYDSVLIYYAGHGYLDEVTKRGYWLPVDAEPDNAANWLSTGDITNLVAGLASRHALIIADSCFSGALTRSTPIPSPDGRASLLRRLATKRSRAILTSGGLEPVLDSGNPGSRHSVFADALLDALRDNNDVVEAGRLFVSVRDRVSAASDQTPQFAPLRNAGHEGGDFIFVRR